MKSCFSRILLLALILILGCDRQGEVKTAAQTSAGDTIPLQYARHFRIIKNNNCYVVDILNPWREGHVINSYILFRDSSELKDVPNEGRQVLQIPVRTIVPLSTSFYGFLKKLGVLGSIAAIENADYVYDPWILRSVSSGVILELGQSGALSVESAINLSPSVVMVSGAEVLGGGLEKLVQAGVPVVQNMDWQEVHPLGRAEWIKLFGLLYDRNELADSLFAAVREDYLHLKDLTTGVTASQEIIFGYNYQGTWFMPGGHSYMAQFARDAGIHYSYGDNGSTGSLALNHEIVYAKHADADFWLHPGSVRAKSELLALDSRYSYFKAFQTGNVYNHTRRTNMDGGNDFWESGAADPQQILSDLIKIFHPSLLPGHELYFYEQLK